MKIALCLSGQARAVKAGYEYYKKNLLSQYDVSVYAHVWDSEFANDVLSLYSPMIGFKRESVSDFSSIDRTYTRTPNAAKYPPRNTFSMFKSMYECRRLLMYSNIQYDWVIRARTDYALNVVIPFDTLDNSKIYIPNCRMTPERDFGNDQFAFGSMDTMLKYMSTFHYIQDYYDAGSSYIGEDLMSANLKKHNLIGENLVYVNMNNPFPPGKHNGTWHSLIRDDYEVFNK